ncbi:hypothetical protein [Flavivirga jejuensis]|uniref:Uncharacterized protein n=1 Tax=Flavivirga jejuensis TaxID=870487 RepID=A0ABT8WLV0_9FLAO|nr:hypothetical protein [Flavivirga jejuensis]MDO5974129.1 hypothetical protein [Flavivirga jejuensis]
MLLTNKQSLILCGLMAGGIFVGGILDILNNFIVLTILTIVFLTIILNLFYFILNSKEEIEIKIEEEAENKNDSK